jgi:GT2 family glycosyltransferase
MPKVSVIIVSWNRKEMLQRCLYSLTKQTYQDFEIIVVDNGSVDGAECYATLRNATNLGFAKAANQGIAASVGEYVALINNDAAANRYWLGELVRTAGMTAAGMYASKVIRPDGSLESAGCYIYHDGNGMCIRNEWPLPNPDFPSGCAAMYRREMLDRIGLFDERMFMYNEDTELGVRAKLAGYSCLYVPGAIVTHHGMSRNNIRKLYHNERNRLLLLMKHYDLGQLIWSVPWTVVRFARILWRR